jgi:chloramphenicol-sensitive protein RarD
MKPEEKTGILYAIAAFGFWGLAPIYFKQVASVAPTEVLAHRVIWSVLVLVVFLSLGKQFSQIKPLFRDPTKLKWLVLSSLLVSTNWLIFIYAVSIGQILEASLGYFINPLISMLFAALFFSESISRNQSIAIGIALLAVIIQVILLGKLPLISLGLAITFALYGAVRKKVHVASLPGLFVETILILPLAIGYLWYLWHMDSIAFGAGDGYLTLMLALAGIVTVLPLLWFNAGTIRLKLGTIGMLQYIGPSVAFLVAIFLYDEAISNAKLFTFVLIWIALGLYSYDLYKKSTNGRL